MKITAIKDLTIDKISQIYTGKDNVCRCGCAGRYVSTSAMEFPRSEIDDKGAQRLLNKAIKFELEESAEIVFEETYINISYGNDRAITIYLDKVKPLK